MNEVSEADVIKEYCNHLGFEDVADIDYSSTNDYLFKIALERALEKNNSTHINEPEPSTTRNSNRSAKFSSPRRVTLQTAESSA